MVVFDSAAWANPSSRIGGFSGLRSLSINELAEKVFTTEGARISRR